MNRFLILLLALRVAAPMLHAEPPALPNDALFALPMIGFFPGEKKGQVKRLNAYLIRRDGKWLPGLGTPTVQGRPVWNTALMPIDASALQLKDGKLTGELKVTLVPDPWVPKDQKARTATVTIDASVQPASAADRLADITGGWKATIPGDAAELEAASLQGAGEGAVEGGWVKAAAPHEVADLSYDLAFYNLIPGETKENFQRRRALSLGIRAGKVLSARLGQMDMRGGMYDFVPLDPPANAGATGDDFHASVSFTTDTLDGEEAKFQIELSGHRMQQWLAGTWKGSYATGGNGKTHEISGFFRGDAKPGAVVAEVVKDDRPWFAESKGFQPPQPGEHPRLFFRKSDLPELRRRAATPEGEKLVTRLRQLLNGSDGKSMPTLYNPATMAYDKSPEATAFKKSLKKEDPDGIYTMSHGAGYGFLYQLTGDKLYADLARQCVEKAWAGQRNYDDRYSWVAPGGELRAGPSIAWYAVAYDLCYDAWEPDFRVKVAQAIQNYSDEKGGEWNNPEGITLKKMVLTPSQGPGSNHFGAVVGGSGLAVLAIKDDPGTDNAMLAKYAEVIERQVVRHFLGGWGDGGYYKEGWGASRVGTRSGFLCLLQALKTARGHDYMNTERTSVSYVTMGPRCLMVLGSPPYFPYRSNMGATYGKPELEMGDGFFSEGFGAIADRYKPGLLWTWNHVFNPKGIYLDDTEGSYPHRPMLAIINWPTFAGITEKNPAEVMPLVTRDRLYEYFVFRNRFQDADDIVTTILINQPNGTKPRDVMVWGCGGLRLEFTEPPNAAKVTHFAAGQDGSGTLTAGEFALAVDYSKASGADALIVTTGAALKPEKKLSDRAQATTVEAGGKTFNILTVSAAGQHPAVKVEGGKLIVSGQTVWWADGKLVLGKFSPEL